MEIFNKEEIEREANDYFSNNFGGILSKELTDRFVNFAKHIADMAIAKERDDCAKTIDDIQCHETPEYCAKAIRARNEVMK